MLAISLFLYFGVSSPLSGCLPLYHYRGRLQGLMPKHIPKVSDVVKASCPKNGAVINIGSFSVSGKNDIPRNNSRVEMEERFDVWKD